MLKDKPCGSRANTDVKVVYHSFCKIGFCQKPIKVLETESQEMIKTGRRPPEGYSLEHLLAGS